MRGRNVGIEVITLKDENTDLSCFRNDSDEYYQLKHEAMDKGAEL